MLYLFNSAARPEYVTNVLNTLHLPNGAINVYQYEGAPYNYADSSASSVSNGEKVVISFVDRNDDEPERNRYIPLRFGVLKKHENNQGKSYFYVELKSFVSTFENFDLELKSSYKDKLFYKENGIEHGFLAFTGKEIVSVQNDGNAEGWIDTVRRVVDCPILINNNCIYTHFTIRDKKDNIISPVSKGKYWEYKLKKSRTYLINIDYYIPFAIETSDADTICFEFCNNCSNFIKPFKNTWGAKNGRQECQIIDLKGHEDLYINYSLKSSDDSKSVVFSDKSVRIAFEKKCWFFRVLPFVIFFASSFVSTLIASMKNHIVQSEKGANIIRRFITWISELDATTICVILAICAVLESLSLLLVKNSLSKDK